MAVTRNSATVTSRRSPSSRCSSAPNERASIDNALGQGVRSSERPGRCRPVAGALATGSRRPPRKSGVEQPLATLRRAPVLAQRSPELAKPRAQAPAPVVGRERVAARSEELQEGLERLRHGELRAVGILRSGLLGVDAQRPLSERPGTHDDRCRRRSALRRAASGSHLPLPALGTLAIRRARARAGGRRQVPPLPAAPARHADVHVHGAG